LAADLMAVATSFVSTLVSNAAARDAFAAAMHPPNPVAAIAVINQYAVGQTPIDTADFPVIVPLIAKLLAEAKAGGATDIPSSIMPGDAGGASGSIMPGDAGGASGSIMPADAEPKEPKE
jgi:hypothetical protein